MPKLDDEIDGLFKLPLAEFTPARNALASRLKKNGLRNEAEDVKALAKPSVSAWAVNQLYWHHREAFDELIATGQRFRKAQASGNMTNMREALEARRDSLSQLSDLATELLRDGGSNPSLDILRRIATTLEAISASSPSDVPTLGRLAHDIDPPGFDAFGGFSPSAISKKHTAKTSLSSSPKKSSAPARVLQQEAASEARRRNETRQTRINGAKASLQDARKSLTVARAAVKSLEGAQKKAEAAAKEAVKQKRDAEERFKKLVAAATEANVRAQNITVELSKATKTLNDAQRAVENAAKELETAFGQALAVKRKS